MNKHYRIIKDDRLYRIKKRYFGFLWIDIEFPDYSFCITIDEAKRLMEKHMKYGRKHRIVETFIDGE